MATVKWKLNLKSEPSKVFEMITTDRGREAFWVNKSVQDSDTMKFLFPNGLEYSSEIKKYTKNKEFQFIYLGETLVTITLDRGDNDNTILELIDEGVNPKYYAEVNAGWVSVLMNLKAVVDFGVDLRNHNNEMTWDQGFLDN